MSYIEAWREEFELAALIFERVIIKRCPDLAIPL
jgi:hypothetical protein